MMKTQEVPLLAPARYKPDSIKLSPKPAALISMRCEPTPRHAPPSSAPRAQTFNIES